MKQNILKESKKENLPLDFITSFVSHGWEEIGNIKAQIEGINTSFKGTTKVEGILQELVDAYLICVGQLEQFMNDKDYVELPMLNEDIASKLILLEPDEIAPALEDIPQMDEIEETVVIETPSVTITIAPSDEEQEEASTVDEASVETAEPFNFFTSFDDIEVDTTEDSPFKAWMNR